MNTEQNKPVEVAPSRPDWKDELLALKMELNSEVAKTREFAIERSDKARNGALGALSLVFAVIGLLIANWQHAPGKNSRARRYEAIGIAMADPRPTLERI